MHHLPFISLSVWIVHTVHMSNPCAYWRPVYDAESEYDRAVCVQSSSRSRRHGNQVKYNSAQLLIRFNHWIPSRIPHVLTGIFNITIKKTYWLLIDIYISQSRCKVRGCKYLQNLDKMWKNWSILTKSKSISLQMTHERSIEERNLEEAWPDWQREEGVFPRVAGWNSVLLVWVWRIVTIMPWFFAHGYVCWRRTRTPSIFKVLIS